MLQMSAKRIGPQYNSNGTSKLAANHFDHEYDFIPPPEAPVFYPTKEEFACGPLEYVAKIRAQAEPHGICKIIPPSDFQPPFAVEVEEFRFTPRIQRLNELEATTRIKLNFIEQIVKFWDLQGASFKIPNLERRALDLYNLHRIVKEEGGFETCTRERKWSRIASRMGYGNNASNKGTIASLLRQHYERILFPYDVFQSGATIGPDLEESKPMSSDDDSDATNKDDDVNKKSPNDNQSTPEKRVLRRQQSSPNKQPLLSPNSQNQSKELKKLQFYGAGPKMPGVQSEQQNNSNNNNNKEPQNKVGWLQNMDSYDNWCCHLPQVCLQCGESNPTHMLLTCDNCDNTYHTQCLIPPLNDWPKGVWHCHRCLALIVKQNPQPYTQEFGFSQSQRAYTLSEFGEMADQFKADYFNRPPHSVPLSLVEKEFWRLVSALEETVMVEYGADLHTNDYGSGFPTKNTKNILPTDMEYVNSAWNLNNLPILEGSVFRHINTNISGMIIPWMYVGMCFATFCWHNEDHWTYSINYLHWGEPKTWYGVPGEHAETFERAMKRAAPELFKSQPDLLHQLVTICNPNILMQDGVPVYRTNQHAGEFVVTFPRAYHTGFNQGLNFAEAVNFAPSDWLPIGRVCITHYAMLHRFPVFSHDELICKMANDPKHLEITMAVATYHDMLRMVETEKTSRLALLEWGVTQAEREAFELLPDDERQCEYCKTTCFLSAVTCACDPAKLVCLNHKEHLCKTCLPSQHTLRYRYTLDELPIMLHHLRQRAERFDEWALKVKKILKLDSKMGSGDESKPLLKDMRELLNDAVSNRYPSNSDAFTKLQTTVNEASKCSRAARDLLKQQEIFRKQQQQCNGNVTQSPTKRTLRSTAVRSANNGSKSENLNTKLTLEEINLFYDEVVSLHCEIAESNPLQQLLNRCNSIASDIMKVLNTSSQQNNECSMNSADLEAIIIDAQSISVVDFGPQLENFKHKYEEIHWLEECDKIINISDEKTRQIKLLELSNIKTLIENGMKLAINTDKINAKMSDLQQMLDEANKWIERAKSCFYFKEEDNGHDVNNRKPTINVLESLLLEVESSNHLKRIQLSPHMDHIRSTVNKSHDWISRAKTIHNSDNPRQSAKSVNLNDGEAPMIDAIEDLVASAAEIDCHLEKLHELNNIITSARNWKDKLSKTFCKKSSLYPLVHIITPRIQQIDSNTFSTRGLFVHLKRLISFANTKERKTGAPNVKPPKSIFEHQLNGNYSRACIVALYKIFEEQEIANIKAIRECNRVKRKALGLHSIDFEFNVAKQELDDEELQNNSFKFCICGKEANELMIQCQLCFDWFHNSCVRNFTAPTVRKKQMAPPSPQESLHPQQHFICVICCRGRRPRLETILSLLCSLQRLSIRVLEGELLQCVAERCIAWQEKTRNALTVRTDLSNAYSRVLQMQNTNTKYLSHTSHQSLHSSPTKTDSLNFGQNTADKSNDNTSVMSAPHNDRNNEDMTTKEEEATAEALLQLRGSQPISFKTESLHSLPQHSQSAPFMSSESNSSNDSSPLKHKRKSPLVLRDETLPQPLIDLSDESQQLLEDLLLEGNCLELTLDETIHLWSIWQLANPDKRTVIYYNNDTDLTLNSNHQKRKSTDIANEEDLQNKKRVIKEKEKGNKKMSPKVRKSTKKSKSDADDLCSMKEKCLRPNVAQVNWVFCDGPCSGWFHQLCIGIDSPDQIASLEQFFCINCRQQK